MKRLRRWILSKLLTPAQRMVLAGIERPMRWQPDQPITPEEAAQWGDTLRSPLMLKLDTAMINMAQQEAQRAIAAPAAETQRMAGYALGVRAGWQIAKSLSMLTGAEAGAREDGEPTAAPTLDHLTP